MLIYALKSAIVLSLLYLPYLLMLRNESFFRFNRVMLCLILITALVLPLCNLPVLSLDDNPVVSAAQHQMIEIGIPIAQGIVGDEPQQEPSATVSWFAVVATLYIIVAVVLLVIRMHDYIRLQRIIHHNCLWHRRENRITIYCHEGDIPPFSWGRSIVISRADYANNGACIIRHETGHILSGHSWDMLLLSAVQLLQWFNPLVWLLGQSLQDVHEYEADDYVLRGGITLDEYRYLLIQKAVGASPYVFANNFNHSLLKKRIKMMCQKKSSPWQRAKALYAIPVALLALSAFATPEFKVVSQTIDNNMGSEATDKVKKPLLIVDGKAVAKEEMNKLTNDSIKSVTVMKGEQATAVFGDEATDGAVVIETKADAVPEDDDKVFSICEELPTFPGGQAAMMEYIIENVRYPKLAFEMGQTGRILVQFIVEKDGTLSNVKAYDGVEELKGGEHEITVISYSADGKEKVLDTEEAATLKEEIRIARQSLKEEAERVVRSMPAWTPGLQRGQAVRVKFMVPIKFNLS